MKAVICDMPWRHGVWYLDEVMGGLGHEGADVRAPRNGWPRMVNCQGSCCEYVCYPGPHLHVTCLTCLDWAAGNNPRCSACRAMWPPLPHILRENLAFGRSN